MFRRVSQVTKKNVRFLNNYEKALTPKQQSYMDLEHQYNAHNYNPIPVVISRGSGVHVWDADGKQYLDFNAGVSAVNQGHCHPRIVKAMCDQAQVLTLMSRGFYTDKLGPYCKFICETLGFDRIIPTNSGAEGCETAVKLARRWGYAVKGIPDDQARVIFPRGNYWGRTLGAISGSTDPSSYRAFGPRMPGFDIVDYDNLEQLEEALKNPNVAAYMAEPIQGEGGVVVPRDGYLKKVSELCKKYNVLFIADEVQTGLGRTGKVLCVDHENVKPDILILSKSLSGGMFPIAAVLAKNEVMLTIKAGEHGSTFGGNPLACVVAEASIRTLIEEKMPENAEKMGKIFRAEMNALKEKMPHVVSFVRGKGLLNAVGITASNKGNAWNVCLDLHKNGLLAKPTQAHTIRFAPPLIINETQMAQGIDLIKNAVSKLA